MTDDDRHLLLELRRMTDACGAFCAGVIEGDLSHDDQLALGDWLSDMAERIRKRALSTPLVIEASFTDATKAEGEPASPVGQIGGAV